MPASIFSETELARLDSFVADQLKVSPDEIQFYARREQPRRQHFTEVREHLGFSMLRSRDLEELEAWQARTGP